jgi:hypothetical protein
VIATVTRNTLICAVMLSVVAPAAHGQFTPEDTGMAPFGSYSGGDIDSVDMASGSLNIHVPLFSLPQKGKLALSFSLRLTPNPYTPTIDCDPAYSGCQVVYQQSSPILPTGYPAISWDQQISVAQASAPSLQYTFQWAYGFDAYAGTPFLESLAYYSDWFALQDGGGQVHPLGSDSANPNIMRATDGSGYTVGDISETTYKYSPPNPGPPYLSANSGISSTVVAKDGVVWTGLCGSTTTVSPALVDPAGNTIGCTLNSQMLDPTNHLPSLELIDSAQRAIPLTPLNPNWITPIVPGHTRCPDLTLQIQNANAQPQPLRYSMDWTVPGPNGTVTYTICYTDISYRTEFFGLPTNIWTGTSGYTLYQSSDTPPDNVNTLGEGTGLWDMATGMQVIQSIVLPNGTY